MPLLSVGNDLKVIRTQFRSLWKSSSWDPDLGTHGKPHVVQRKNAGMRELVHGASLPAKAKPFARVRKSSGQLRHSARTDWWL